jgi:hypothetical protein
MRKPKRRRLFLEQLEGRDCPSLTVMLLSGSLYIRGTPLGQVQVNEIAANKLQVLDNATAATPSNLGTYTVTNGLTMSLNSHPDAILVNLMGNTLQGSVFINVGTGDSTGLSHVVAVESPAAGAAVTGSVQFLGGTNETYNIGLPTLATPNPITVKGGVTATGKTSSGTSAGGTLFIGPGSTVLGDVNATFLANVDIGEPTVGPVTTVNGSVTANNATNGASLITHIFGNVGKNVSVTGDNGNFGDVFELGQWTPGPVGTVADGGIIGGNLSVSMGSGGSFGNFINLMFGSLVGGNVNLTTSGAGAGGLGDSVTVANQINGSLSVTVGSANNTVGLNDGTNGAMVSGDFRLTAGNGNNTLDLTLGSGATHGFINGSIFVNLGNGNDTATFSDAPGGTLNWTSGNGADSVTLGNANTAAGETWKVNMRFGTGNDTLTLSGAAPATQSLTGFIDMGGPPGGNSFDPTLSMGVNWQAVSPFTLQNV